VVLSPGACLVDLVFFWICLSSSLARKGVDLVRFEAMASRVWFSLSFDERKPVDLVPAGVRRGCGTGLCLVAPDSGPATITRPLPHRRRDRR
jgi:hypothetical protein